jgi:hypothetical protein
MPDPSQDSFDPFADAPLQASLATASAECARAAALCSHRPLIDARQGSVRSLPALSP